MVCIEVPLASEGGLVFVWLEHLSDGSVIEL